MARRMLRIVVPCADDSSPDQVAKLAILAPSLLAACEAAEFWLTEEARSPTRTKPEAILQLLRDTIAAVGGSGPR